MRDAKKQKTRQILTQLKTPDVAMEPPEIRSARETALRAVAMYEEFLRLSAPEWEEHVIEEHYKRLVETNREYLAALGHGLKNEFQCSLRAIELAQDWWAIFPEFGHNLLQVLPYVGLWLSLALPKIAQKPFQRACIKRMLAVGMA